MHSFYLDKSPYFNLIELGDVSSTNTFLADYHPLYETEITLVTAEYQFSGRGQKGSAWESKRSQNLLFSIMLRPTWLWASKSFMLSEIIALAIQRTVYNILSEPSPNPVYLSENSIPESAQYEGRTSHASKRPVCTIKWPNDIYVGTNKIAGILIENDICGRSINRSIIGCGVNVNQTEFSFPLVSSDHIAGKVASPTSLALLTCRACERQRVLECIMGEFYALYNDICKGEMSKVHDAYMKVMYHGAGIYHFRDAGGDFMASITAIEPSGHLHLTDDKGHDRRYAFKEVAFL